MTQITALRVEDIRFPTSQQLDGSDAMNPDPDYSAAYVILETDNPKLTGHGLTFTIGRGNEICCAGLARTKGRFTWRPARWSMRCGICGRRPKANRSGDWSPI